MLNLHELRAFYSVELRNLVEAIDRLDRQNDEVSFDQCARLKTLAISESIARQRLSNALAEKLGAERPVSLVQYINGAAIDASHGVRQ